MASEASRATMRRAIAARAAAAAGFRPPRVHDESPPDGLGGRRDHVAVAIGELFPPRRVCHAMSCGVAMPQHGRQPRDVDEMASHRAQPDAEELLVEDRARLLLELRQRLARQREARMPLDALADVAAGQPVRDVFAIAMAERRVRAERLVADRR